MNLPYIAHLVEYDFTDFPLVDKGESIRIRIYKEVKLYFKTFEEAFTYCIRCAEFGWCIFKGYGVSQPAARSAYYEG